MGNSPDPVGCQRRQRCVRSAHRSGLPCDGRATAAAPRQAASTFRMPRPSMAQNQSMEARLRFAFLAMGGLSLLLAVFAMVTARSLGSRINELA